MLLVFGAPGQLDLLAGHEHGRTIPLAVIGRTKIPQCSGLLPYRVLSYGWQHRRGRQRAASIRTIQVGPKDLPASLRQVGVR